MRDAGIDPWRRRGGYRPEQLPLVAQHHDVADPLGAVGQQHRQVGQHPAPVMHRSEVLADQPDDSAPVRPTRSATSRGSADPACDTTSVPAALTDKPLDHDIDCTRKVLQIGVDETLDKSYLPRSGALFTSRHTEHGERPR